MIQIPIVPLGRDCTSAYLARMLHVHGNYHYNNGDHATQIYKENNLGMGSNIFDWVYISDDIKFARTIANMRHVQILSKIQLDFVPPAAPLTVVDRETGIGWHHLFRRSTLDQTILIDQVDSQFQQARSKVQYLRDKFIKHASSFTVYLYFDHWSEKKSANLCRALRIFRLDQDFKLIYIANNYKDNISDAGSDEAIAIALPFEYHISEAISNGPGTKTDILMGHLKKTIEMISRVSTN